RGTRSHRRREVLFRSSRLQAPALERALLLYGMRRQLFRAGKDPPSRQSEQSRRRCPPSCLYGGGVGIRSGARNHAGARRRTRQIFRRGAHHVPRSARLFPRPRWQRDRDHRSLQEIASYPTRRGDGGRREPGRMTMPKWWVRPVVWVGCILVAVLTSGTGNAEYRGGTIKIGVLNDQSGLYADIAGTASVWMAR